MIKIQNNNVQNKAAIEREIKIVMCGRSESRRGDGMQNQSWQKQIRIWKLQRCARLLLEVEKIDSRFLQSSLAH